MPRIITQSDINRVQRQQYKKQMQNEIKTSVSQSDVRASYYQMQQWKSLRSEYRRLHPLDELSLLYDRVEAAQDIHHLLSPFEYGRTPEEITLLMLDADNLIALTKQHHGFIHGNRSALTDEEKAYLKERTEAVRRKYHYRF